VVGLNGLADSTTFTALLASSPELIPEARIPRSRFRPAVRNGVTVRQLVVQLVVWRFER
jgi:hypothetical protein